MARLGYTKLVYIAGRHVVFWEPHYLGEVEPYFTYRDFITIVYRIYI